MEETTDNTKQNTEESTLVVAKEVAEKDVKRWLDFKKILHSRREEKKKSVAILVGAVSEGVLVLNDDFTWEHKLCFPLEKIDKLIYKSRISVDDVLNASKGVDASEGALIYMSLLTGKVKGVIRKLDSEDFAICEAIASFFA